jgi:hypothetical protein
MTRIALPVELSGPICDRAAQICREDILGRGWRTSGAIQPFPAEGQVGLRTTVKYLMYQNEGIRPFIMWWVEGKVVPLGCKQGDGPHIRTGKGAGQPGYVDIPHKGKTWRDQKWRHPGIKPQRFMQSAIQKAVKENKGEIKAYLMKVISGVPL